MANGFSSLFGGVSSLLLQTLDAVTQVRPRVLKLGAGLVLTDNTDGTATAAVTISSLTADGSPDSAADYVMTYDASATALKKVLLDDLPSGGGGTPTTLQITGTNTTGGTLVKGTVVGFNGSDANGLTLFAVNVGGSAAPLGMVAADILDTASGLVTIQGTVTGIDTSASSVGDELYVDPITPGTFTSTASLTLSQNYKRIGFVTVSHETLGEVVMAPAKLTPPNHEHGGSADGGTGLAGTNIGSFGNPCFLSDNEVSNYFDFVEISEPASPASGRQRLWVDSTSHTLKAKTSAGVVRSIG